MKITRVETLTARSYREATWLLVHTDEGPTGLGETWSHQERAADFVHRVAAPYLLGQDPRLVERHHRRLRGARDLTWGRTNGDANGLSAIDFALWDLFGQSVGRPVYELLGGAAQESVRLYNTCHGTSHPFYWEPALEPPDPNDLSARLLKRNAYLEDQVMWQQQGRTAELAKSLLEMGITAMKIWPFDPHRLGTEGGHITQAQLEVALRPFREVRDAVGMQMDLLAELHGGWYLQAAVRIAEALAEIRPMWIEDPLRDRMNIAAHAELARRTPIPIAISEAYCGRATFQELLEREAAGIVNMDLAWVGGITEGHHIAQLAAGHSRPFALHGPCGPVNWTASAHVSLAEPNTLIQEGVRASWRGGWYDDVVEELPRFERGRVRPPSGPGLGTRLRREFLARSDVVRRVTER
jgi:galactonate dehydratase